MFMSDRQQSGSSGFASLLSTLSSTYLERSLLSRQYAATTVAPAVTQLTAFHARDTSFSSPATSCTDLRLTMKSWTSEAGDLIF